MTQFLTAPIMYALTAALLGSLLFGGLQCSAKNVARLESAELRADLAESDTKLAEVNAAIAGEREAFLRQARADEQRHSADMARIAQEDQQRIDDEKASADRLISDLRADRVRLHARWQAAIATAELSAAVAAAAQLDEAERERQDSAARIIGAADRCDAQVKGLQDVVRAMLR